MFFFLSFSFFTRVLSSRASSRLSHRGGFELHGDTVHAVSQTGGFPGTVGEDVSEVSLACGAPHLGVERPQVEYL